LRFEQQITEFCRTHSTLLKFILAKASTFDF
jgi:hypothetical protein